MIQQPELGRKISNCRKTKGLTQQDLVTACNINIRTLQRIEAGEVTPRPYTVKLIFEVLELDFNNSYLPPMSKKELLLKWFKKARLNFIDLFNLKTNTMKKITILSLILFALVFGISSLANKTFAQSEKKVKEIIEHNNSNFVNWFNDGNIESIIALYKEDACIIASGCGKIFIKDYYKYIINSCKVVKITTTNLSLQKSLAVEKGTWEIQIESGKKIKGEYITEWQLVNKKWLIANESSERYPEENISN